MNDANKSGRERRRAIRCNLKAPAECMLFSDFIVPDNPQRTGGLVRNLSTTGVCIVVNRVAYLKQEIIDAGIVKIGILLKLPTADDIRLLGSIVWARPQDTLDDEERLILGVETKTITNVSQDNISKYIVDFYMNKKINQ